MNDDVAYPNRFLIVDGTRGFHGQLALILAALEPDVIADVTAEIGGVLPDLDTCDGQDLTELADAIERVTYDHGSPIWWDGGDVYGPPIWWEDGRLRL